MLTISIKGLSDGTYPVEASAQCSDIEYMVEEFVGALTISGTLRKYGTRYLFDLCAEAPAKLLCDVSGEEFEEVVHTEFALEYIASTMLANLHADRVDAEPPFYIREDDMSIDISGEVRQEMVVNLPLKRIAPKYRDKEFTDVFPEFAETENQDTDPRWAALKAIKFDKQ